ncbi:MAG: SDR family oxidoreductase [Pseudomonadota bacterium]
MSHHTKTIVIAGGSAGVGRATAEMFARDGHDLVLIARGKERLESAKRELRDYGSEVLTITADVADPAAMRKARDSAIKAFGGIDIWINCAMATVFGPFDKMSDEEFRRVMDVTFMGQVHGARVALEHFRERGEGHLISVGSGLAHRSVPLQSAYCASKAATESFMSSIRSELIHDGFDDIHVSQVQLPAINTPQFDWARSKLDQQPRPAAPVYQPSVAARAIGKAVAEKNRELLVGTSVMQLVFGNAVASDFLDHKMAEAGWDGQHSEDDQAQDRAGNLMEPKNGDWDAYGTYGDEAADSDDGFSDIGEDNYRQIESEQEEAARRRLAI